MEVLGIVRVLSHLDPILRTHRATALGVVEERVQVRVERGACGVGPEIERGTYRGTGTPESSLR